MFVGEFQHDKEESYKPSQVTTSVDLQRITFQI